MIKKLLKDLRDHKDDLISVVNEYLNILPGILKKDIVIKIKNPQIDGVKIGDEVEIRIVDSTEVKQKTKVLLTEKE